MSTLISNSSFPPTPLPCQKAEHEASDEASESEPKERRIGLCLSASPDTIDIRIDSILPIDTAVDDGIVGEAFAALVILVAGTGIGAYFCREGL